jgi:hypothetical protein
MQMQNDNDPTALVPTQPEEMLRYTDVPGRLKWFEQGSPEHQNWIEQRTEFIKSIDANTAEGQTIQNDIVDTLVESEIPTGLISISRAIHK